jgi:hypothetical protein
MEPASNFRNSAAVPFCSDSKIINASLANYDTPGFKLRQLLETGAAEASGHDQARYVFIRIEQSGTGAFLSGIARKIFSQNAARRMRNRDAAIINTEFRKHHTNTQAPLDEQAGTAFRCNHWRRATLTHC